MSYEMTEEELRDDCQYWQERRKEDVEELLKKTLNHLQYICSKKKSEKFRSLSEVYNFSKKDDVFSYIKNWKRSKCPQLEFWIFPDVYEVAYKKMSRKLCDLYRSIKP